MAKATAFQFRRWENRLLHISQRRQGVPQELLDWTQEHFGKSPDVQRLFGLSNAMKPEAETAVAVMQLLDKRGVKIGKTRLRR